MGEPNEVKLGRGEFHENPSACICESSLMNNQESDLHSIGFDRSETSDYQNFEDEQDMADLEDVDSENTLPERLEIPRDISKDPRAILTSDQPEEELLSD